MTQFDLNARSEARSDNRDLWIAGAAILGIVFVPTLIAFAVSFITH